MDIIAFILNESSEAVTYIGFTAGVYYLGLIQSLLISEDVQQSVISLYFFDQVAGDFAPTNNIFQFPFSEFRCVAMMPRSYGYPSEDDNNSTVIIENGSANLPETTSSTADHQVRLNSPVTGEGQPSNINHENEVRHIDMNSAISNRTVVAGFSIDEDLENLFVSKRNTINQ